MTAITERSMLAEKMAQHLLRISDIVVPVKSDWNAGLEMTLSAQRQMEREMKDSLGGQPYDQVMNHIIAECQGRRRG